MNMGAQGSIYQKSGIGNYYRMSPHHTQLVKKIWENIEKNPTIYGNGFFISVCERNPKFLMYFSKTGKAPMQIDSALSAKFSHILETLGYIILDCYNNPKQLDTITGYTAMVHKDMRADLQYFLDFTSHLVDFLAMMFPDELTPECQEDLKKYLASISYEISSKMEDFLRYEMMGLEESSGFLSCSPCSSFSNKLIFGQTLLYWKNRKRIWEDKINKLEDNNISEPTVVASTEDDESIAYKSKTDDDLSEWTVEPIPSFDRQGLYRRTKMLTTDAESTTYTDEKKNDGTSDYSDLHIPSSVQQEPRQVGNLKKPGSQSEKLNIPKHVTVKTFIKNNIKSFDDPKTQGVSNSDSARQRFRSRNSSHGSPKTATDEISEKSDNKEEKDTSSARERRRMRVTSLNR